MNDARNRILDALRTTADLPVSALDLVRATGLSAGPLLANLERLEQDGILRSKWADTDHYPRRRLYWLADDSP